MAEHNIIGLLGEKLAMDFFIAGNYDILFKNWRHGHWEIDLIANKNNVLHFIEVKCRTSGRYGFPEESVDVTKLKNLINASAEFLFQYPQWQRVQFDILSIILPASGNPEYFLIEDVYL